jgi:hypothetical protein
MARVRRYAYTARRKAALRKAQLISASKRRGKKRNIKNAAFIGGVGALTGAAVYGGARGGKAVKSRKARNIDRMVDKEWSPGGTKSRAADVAFGQEVATMNRHKGSGGSGTVDRRRAPLRPYVPSAVYPTGLDRQLFIRSMWIIKFNKKGQPFKRPHSDDEMRRRRRNQTRNSPLNDLTKKNISPWEALQRTNAYDRSMRAKGIRINLSHRNAVYREYLKQRGDEF